MPGVGVAAAMPDREAEAAASAGELLAAGTPVEVAGTAAASEGTATGAATGAGTCAASELVDDWFAAA
jgi:hypothetical protein